MTPLDFVFGVIALAVIAFIVSKAFDHKAERLEKIIARMQREEVERDFKESQKSQVREDFEKECG